MSRYIGPPRSNFVPTTSKEVEALKLLYPMSSPEWTVWTIWDKKFELVHNFRRIGVASGEAVVKYLNEILKNFGESLTKVEYLPVFVLTLKEPMPHNRINFVQYRAKVVTAPNTEIVSSNCTFCLRGPAAEFLGPGLKVRDTLVIIGGNFDMVTMTLQFTHLTENNQIVSLPFHIFHQIQKATPEGEHASKPYDVPVDSTRFQVFYKKARNVAPGLLKTIEII